MCGRFTLAAPPEELIALFELDLGLEYPPRYNIAPTQPILAVRADAGSRSIDLLRWGFIPSWAKDPAAFSLLINARIESVREKPTFRAAIRRRRCLIPADGFYEWQKIEKASKQPYWIAPADGSIMAFAGIWETATGGDGSEVDTCAILTMAANDTLQPIHHRMPVVIRPKLFDQWLFGHESEVAGIVDAVTPAGNDFFRTIAVSTRVNSAANDDAGLIGPANMDSAGRGNDAERQTAMKTAQTKKPGGGQLDLF